MDRVHSLAAFAIEDGYRALTHGARPRSMPWKNDGVERMPHWQTMWMDERRFELIQLYHNWHAEVKDSLNYSVCMDAINGDRLGVIEKRYGLRFGKGKLYLRDGLEVYCRQVGWL